MVQHRGVLLDGDHVHRDGIPVVAAARLALELPMVVDLEHAVCFVSELLHRGDTTIADIKKRYAAMTRWPHSLNADVVMRLADARCESVGERRFLVLCWRHHLPKPTPQYEVRDAHGRLVARLDFAWPEHGVFAEFDGMVKYQRLVPPGWTASDVVVAEKRREDLVREITGFRGVRVTWPDLDEDQATALRLERLLDRDRVA